MRIVTNKNAHSSKTELHRQICSYVSSFYEMSKLARQPMERHWLQYWAMYFNTPEAQAELRSMVLQVVGNVSTEWRHRISLGKSFEIVETVHGYLMASTFPNSEWFVLEPYEPVDREVMRGVTKHARQQLDRSNFRSFYDMFLRQAIVTGVSTLSMPWNDEEQSFQFEVLDNFDVYYDYSAPCGFTDSAVLIVRRCTRADALMYVRSGKFDLLKEEDVMTISGENVDTHSEIDRVKEFNGLSLTHDVSLQDVLVFHEYWGDLHLQGITLTNMKVLKIGDKLAHYEESPYDNERPFVTVSYTPVVRSPVGIGILQPVAGALATLDIMNNQRLDNAELNINNMWTLRETSVLSPEEVFSEPGKVLRVSEHDDIRPLLGDVTKQSLAMNESSFIESAIEKTTSTGAFISPGQGRKGDRVTAEEIVAVQEAGGNRLSNTFKHIENTGMVPILRKVVHYNVEYLRKDSVVPLSGYKPNEVNYYDIGPREVRGFKYRFVPRGADYVVGQKAWVERRTQFLALISSIPEFAAKINYEALLLDILEGWGFEDPMKYLAQAEETEALSPIQAMGGKPLENAIGAELALDGGSSAIESMTGQNLGGVNFADILARIQQQTQTLEGTQ